jgi:N-methylhydantoinase A
MGLLRPDRFLGGRIQLDRDAAEAALTGIAQRLGITGAHQAARAAEAALQVTTAMMSTELYKTMAQRGQDPRDFALMAFGGAGPTHGVLLAEEARLSTVVVPPAPATFCALGAILADVKRDYVRSRHLRLSDDGAITMLRRIFSELESEANAWIRDEGDLLGKPRFMATCDMRYAGQAFDLPVEVDDTLRRAPDADALAEGLHSAHEKIYGFRDPDSGVEITAVRIRVIGQIPPIPLPEAPPHDGSALEASEWRRIFHQGRHIDVPVYVRGRLNVGQHLTGPAIVEQEDCTIWAIPDWQGKTDATGNLILSKSK